MTGRIMELADSGRIFKSFAEKIEARLSGTTESGNKAYVLTDLQEKAFNSEIWYEKDRHQNVLISGATSSGKTLVAETIIANYINNGKSAIYLVPLKAMVMEKQKQLEADFEDEDIDVYSSSSDQLAYDENILHGKYEIAVIVYEKFFSLLAQTAEMMDNCGVVVVDELQMVGDKDRGPKLEFALLKVMKNYPTVNIVGLCISDCETSDLRNWLGIDSNSNTYVLSTERPVGLDEYIIDLQGNYKWRRVYGEREEKSTEKKDDNSEDGTLRLIKEVAGNSKIEEKKRILLKSILYKIYEDRESEKRVVVFVGSKTKCLNIAYEICRYGLFEKNEEIVRQIEDELGFQDADEYIEIMKEKLLPYGVAIHNAGLSVQARETIENNFGDVEKKVKLVVATETLMIGMNMPVDVTILYDYEIFKSNGRKVQLTTQQYKNYIGRAGRLGYYKNNCQMRGESYLLAEQKINNLCKKYMFPQKEKIVSSLKSAKELELAPYFMTLLMEKNELTKEEIAGLMKDSLYIIAQETVEKEKVAEEKIEPILRYAETAEMINKYDHPFLGSVYTLKDFGVAMAPYALSLKTSMNMKKDFFKGEKQSIGEKSYITLPIEATITDILKDKYLLDILYEVCISEEIKNSPYLKLQTPVDGSKPRVITIYNQVLQTVKDFIEKAMKSGIIREEGSVFCLFKDDTEMEAYQWNAAWRSILLYYWFKGETIQNIKKKVKVDGFRILTGDLSRLAEVCSYQIEVASKCISLPAANPRGDAVGDLQHSIYVFSRCVKYGVNRELLIVANKHIFGLSRNAVIALGRVAKEKNGEDYNIISYIKRAEEEEWKKYLKKVQRDQLLLSIDDRCQGKLEEKIDELFNKECLINEESKYKLLVSWNDMTSKEGWQDYLEKIFSFGIGIGGLEKKQTEYGIQLKYDRTNTNSVLMGICLYYVDEVDKNVPYQKCIDLSCVSENDKNITITNGFIKSNDSYDNVLCLEWKAFMSLLVACIYEKNSLNCGKHLGKIMYDLEGVMDDGISLKEWQKVVKNYDNEKDCDETYSNVKVILIYSEGPETRSLSLIKKFLNDSKITWSHFSFVGNMPEINPKQKILWLVDEWMLRSHCLYEYIKNIVDKCKENLLIVGNGNPIFEKQIQDRFNYKFYIINSADQKEFERQIYAHVSVEKPYLVALSYPDSEKEKSFFDVLANALGKKYGKSRILYDGFWNNEFVCKNNNEIKEMYKNNAMLHVWCVTVPEDSSEHIWWKSESEGIYEFEKTNSERVIYVGFNENKCESFTKLQREKYGDNKTEDLFINPDRLSDGEKAIEIILTKFSERIDRMVEDKIEDD